MSDQKNIDRSKYLDGIGALSRFLGVSYSTARTIWRRKLVPGVQVGHRTVLFHPGRVEEALAKIELKAAKL
jgi:hypothetical protein